MLTLFDCGQEAMAADVLSDVLRTVRLTGATFFDVVAKAPWAVESPPRERILPEILPDAELVAHAWSISAQLDDRRVGKAGGTVTLRAC